MTPLSLLARRTAAFAILAALAGCQVGPQLPLMSPLDAGGGFGYSERLLSEGRFEVSYLGPSVRTSVNRTKREEDAEKARSLAYDLALWHAAQVALENDRAAFTVEDRRTDVEVEIVDEGPYFPYFDRIFRYGFHRYSSFYDYAPVFTWAWLRAQVTLTVAMRSEVSEKAFDAAATVERLKEKYPDSVVPAQY